MGNYFHNRKTLNMDEYLKTLMDECQDWLKLYARTEERAEYKEQYKTYYQFQQFCLNYFNSKEKAELIDLEHFRKEHHRWQSIFNKKNFLSESQNLGTIQSAYKELLVLDGEMNVINWKQVKLTDSSLDQQFQKEIKKWIADCKNWLSKNGGGTVIELNALELAQAFLDTVKVAQATQPEIGIQV